MPLRDATAARAVSREMRDEVDEVWRAWGIRATAKDQRVEVRKRLRRFRSAAEFNFGPLLVWVFEGSHAHHLASLGLWWLALLVAEEPDFNAMAWSEDEDSEDWTSDDSYYDLEDHEADHELPDQSPLMVVAQARRPVGRTAEGETEWAYALGDEEAARAVRAAVVMGANVNRRLCGALPLIVLRHAGVLRGVQGVPGSGGTGGCGWWLFGLGNGAGTCCPGGHEAAGGGGAGHQRLWLTRLAGHLFCRTLWQRGRHGNPGGAGSRRRSN